MNIEEYRAMKAQEAQEQEQKDSQSREEQPNVQAQPTTTATHESAPQAQGEKEQPSSPSGGEEGASGAPSADKTEQPNETALPTTVDIDGVAVPIEELKNGYLRQSDYTKKTQELARERDKQKIQEEYFKALNSNPQLAQAFAKQFNLPYVDPTQAQLIEANNKYQDLLLKQEVDALSAKYSDFDAREVLQFAYDNKIENLEHAYTLISTQKGANTQATPSVDVDSIKEQIRQELLNELQSNVDTQSIIQSGGDSAPVRDNSPVLSNQEIKIARNLRMTPEEYAKWRDKR